MQSHHAAISFRNYWDCQHSDPPLASAFGANRGIEDEAQLPAERIGPHGCKNSPEGLRISRHRPFAHDRSSTSKAKQLVHFLGPGEFVVACNVAVPVASAGVLFSTDDVRRVYEDVPMCESAGRLLMEQFI